MSARGVDRSARSVYTVGHSTRSAEALVALLREAGVGALADVRRHPGSRRHPHFARAALEATLAEAGIRYRFLGEALGGRRSAQLPPERSPNRGWQVASFRHYADWMASDAFREGLEALEALAAETPTAAMCAEGPWWRCHRRLLADRLHVRGWRVVHLLAPGRAQEHALTEWARVEEDGALTYPGLV